jgi:hypothetical protein
MDGVRSRAAVVARYSAAEPVRVVMKRSGVCIAVLAALSIAAAAAASAQTRSGVDKLYILNCGEGVAATFLAGRQASMSASRWISSITVT